MLVSHKLVPKLLILMPPPYQQTYDCCHQLVVLEVIDGLVVAIFGLEVILKIISEGMKPLVYFTGLVS